MINCNSTCAVITELGFSALGQITASDSWPIVQEHEMGRFASCRTVGCCALQVGLGTLVGQRVWEARLCLLVMQELLSLGPVNLAPFTSVKYT